MDSSKKRLQQALQTENSKFTLFFNWLERHMPPAFFDELSVEELTLITHRLMELDLQDFFSQITVGSRSFALCLQSPDADLKILKEYPLHGIKSYRTFVSNALFPQASSPLRIALLNFAEGKDSSQEVFFSLEEQEHLFTKLKTKNARISKGDFSSLLADLSPKFLRSLSFDRSILALETFFRTKETDHCQYEVKYNENPQTKETPSLQIVFSWKGIFKHNFLFKLAKLFYRHNLAIKRVNATYVNPYSAQNTLVMSLAVHGIHDKAAWEETDIEDLLQELATLKHFEGLEKIEETFLDTKLLGGNLCNLIKSMVVFIHQALTHCDLYCYDLEHIEEGLCRHPEITSLLTAAFEQKFHPRKCSISDYEQTQKELLERIDQIDTANQLNDVRRKSILKQAITFIDCTLKTNFYRMDKTAFCFRLNPDFFQKIPCSIVDKFPSLPYAVYFMKGFHFLGFHVRFKDLARGGLRTVSLQNKETLFLERNNVLFECYSLAYTQQKKNKDIPEGGAKGIIFLEPLEYLQEEISILQKELQSIGLTPEQIEERTKQFSSEQKKEHLYHSQRAYVESLLTLINCHTDGTLKATHVIDYLKKPEYIYLGPDENMSNDMIEWISNYSKQVLYPPGSAFISSKPSMGINHKEFGVTSLGVNVCMEEVLKHLKIDPFKDSFTVKMTGGPDGDVAGNQMLNLLRYYPETAKLLTTIDISGVILDPKGLDLTTIKTLFMKEQPIRFYPPHKLSDGGFLLDLQTKKDTGETLCWKKERGNIAEAWLSTHEVNHLLKDTIYKTKADVFIPGGGRPRTLNETNIQEFLGEDGKPTAKAIIEGANLYLTPRARRTLEEQGVLIIKDSSANKGGVICSSFEVLSGLCLHPEEFIKEKPELVQEIQAIIASKAKQEAKLLLATHEKTHDFLTDISEKISEKINRLTYDLLSHLEPLDLPSEKEHPLNQILLSYCPSILSQKYPDRIFFNIPDIHKKAIIACHLASQLIYKKGLSWNPKISDILSDLHSNKGLQIFNI